MQTENFSRIEEFAYLGRSAGGFHAYRAPFDDYDRSFWPTTKMREDAHLHVEIGFGAAEHNFARLIV